MPAASLPFSMRVEEVVALGRLPHEDPIRGLRPADRTAVAAAIDRVGLGPLVGRDARELSLGERQLVLLGLAVAQDAPLMLLDEPTIHLDLRHQVETMELLIDLNERDGTTILAVLHDLNLAMHFFPRLLVLDAGPARCRRSPGGRADGRTRARRVRGRPGAGAAGSMSPRPLRCADAFPRSRASRAGCQRRYVPDCFRPVVRRVRERLD